MNCCDPIATPSVMLPEVTAEILAMLRTSSVFHSGHSRRLPFPVGSAQLRLWHWQRRSLGFKATPGFGDT